MHLVIDIGNTNAVFGVYRSDRLLHRWRVGTDIQKTRDEYLVQTRKFLAEGGIDSSLILGTTISSVVPCLTATFQHITRELTGSSSYVVDHESFTDMAIRVDFPSQVGTDRLVNALAGYRLLGTSLIIVDCGTATNFDVVSANGEFLGGVISPGLSLSLEALIKKTHKLPGIKMEPPARVIGSNTVASMQSGLLFGYAGLVDSMIARIGEELGYSPKVVATGGLARILQSVSIAIKTVIDDLTLRGLYFISRSIGDRQRPQ